jgi:hypothetical protein
LGRCRGSGRIVLLVASSECNSDKQPTPFTGGKIHFHEWLIDGFINEKHITKISREDVYKTGNFILLRAIKICRKLNINYLLLNSPTKFSDYTE